MNPNTFKHPVELLAPFPFLAVVEPGANPVGDPGFARGGAPTLGVGGWRQHTILPNFRENCMKLKEFGHPGDQGASLPPLRSAPSPRCKRIICQDHCRNPNENERNWTHVEAESGEGSGGYSPT